MLAIRNRVAILMAAIFVAIAAACASVPTSPQARLDQAEASVAAAQAAVLAFTQSSYAEKVDDEMIVAMATASAEAGEAVLEAQRLFALGNFGSAATQEEIARSAVDRVFSILEEARK